MEQQALDLQTCFTAFFSSIGFSVSQEGGTLDVEIVVKCRIPKEEFGYPYVLARAYAISHVMTALDDIRTKVRRFNYVER